MWSDDQWGNFIADRVAEGDVDNPLLRNIDIQVEDKPMKDAFRPILLSGWHIMEGDQLLVKPIRSIVPIKRFENYVANRDKDRADPDKKWQGSTMELAVKASATVLPRAAVHSIMFDKSFELNSVKYGADAEKCVLCGQDESLAHLLECKSDIQAGHRTRMRRAVRNVTEQEELENPNIYHAMNRLRELELLAPVQAATSVFTKHSVAFLKEAFECLSEQEVKVCKKLLIRRGKIQMTMLVNMYIARSKKTLQNVVLPPTTVINRVSPTDFFQPRINDVFLPVSISSCRIVGGRRRKPGFTKKSLNPKLKKKVFKDKRAKALASPPPLVNLRNYYGTVPVVPRSAVGSCSSGSSSGSSSERVYTVSCVDSRGGER
jgi:hypothetical protein